MTCVDATLDIMAIIYATETNRGRRELFFKKREKKRKEILSFHKNGRRERGGKGQFLELRLASIRLLLGHYQRGCLPLFL